MNLRKMINVINEACEATSKFTSFEDYVKRSYYRPLTPSEVLDEIDNLGNGMFGVYAGEILDKFDLGEGERDELIDILYSQIETYLQENGYEEDLDGEWRRIEDLEESKVDVATLKEEIENAIKDIYEDDTDTLAYINVVVNKITDGRIRIEVTAELDYEGMTNLAYKLDTIIVKYDKDAYFDQVTGGMMEAFLTIK